MKEYISVLRQCPVFKNIPRERISDLIRSLNGVLKSYRKNEFIVFSGECIAEIGIDMEPFKTAEHICSWAGLCPGNNESAGKRKSASVTKGNPYIKSMLCEIAWVIAGKRNTYLSAWYWRIKQKKGAKKAIVALARKLLVIIYTMLKQGTLFDESCFETRRKNCEQKQLSRYIRELEKHGYHVEAQS